MNNSYFCLPKQIIDWSKKHRTPNYLCFTAEEVNSTVSMSKVGNPHDLNLEYSIDDQATWNIFTPDSTIITLADIGDKVYLRASYLGNQSISLNSFDYWFFYLRRGKIAASGDITSLLVQYGLKKLTTEHTFYKLFSDCISLTKAPELPAKQLTEYCYSNMFQNCTLLTKAPALSATELAKNCYSHMFQGCTSLTSTPVLPASDCVYVQGCYDYMFCNCRNLSIVNVNFTYWNNFFPFTTEWLNGVNSTGNFYCPASLPDERGTSYIPYNWNKIDK